MVMVAAAGAAEVAGEGWRVAAAAVAAIAASQITVYITQWQSVYRD